MNNPNTFPNPVDDAIRSAAYAGAESIRKAEADDYQRKALLRAAGHAVSRMAAIVASALLTFGAEGASGFDAGAFAEGFNRYEKIRAKAVDLGMTGFDQGARDMALQMALTHAGEVNGWTARLIDQALDMAREIRASETTARQQITRIAETMIAVRSEIGNYSLTNEAQDYAVADDFVTRLYLERGLDTRTVAPVMDWELLGA
jgi:hypothetical protein